MSSFGLKLLNYVIYAPFFCRFVMEVCNRYRPYIIIQQFQSKLWYIGVMGVAVSSFLKPWVDVYALPEKINMAVTESDPDPKVRKNAHNFFLTVRPLSWACGHGTEMLLILRKLFLTWLLSNIFRYDSPKKCPTILYAANPLGLLWMECYIPCCTWWYKSQQVWDVYLDWVFQCLATSATLVKHWDNLDWTSRVCWDDIPWWYHGWLWSVVAV